MGLDDRLGLFLLGAAIGFIAGYIVRSLKKIEEEIEEIAHLKDEAGFLTQKTALAISLVMVVLLTAFAAFETNRVNNESQKVNDRVQANQDRIERITSCNRDILEDVVKALNERTTYSLQQAFNNVELKKSQKKYLRVLLERPPVEQDQLDGALKMYFDDVKTFIDIQEAYAKLALENPYPTTEMFDKCLDGE